MKVSEWFSVRLQSRYCRAVDTGEYLGMWIKKGDLNFLTFFLINQKINIYKAIGYTNLIE